MTIRSRLASVLRARKAQEDIARGEVARANARLADAGELTVERAGAMERWAVPRNGDAAGYLAAVAAGRALASALYEARTQEDAAREISETEVDKLREAARRRRSVEKLVERGVEERRVKDLAAEQRAADEVGSRRRGDDR
ncbi:hypothetical protein [Actinokineospora enzanensis]|uniref:hypothetical protein n=1 Tax=Actinokineospora enzanensis TaxID=155975 RepID=UPI0003720D2B|nr:hypothetical protein [Actinokineospora enzanensis]